MELEIKTQLINNHNFPLPSSVLYKTVQGIAKDFYARYSNDVPEVISDPQVIKEFLPVAERHLNMGNN